MKTKISPDTIATGITLRQSNDNVRSTKWILNNFLNGKCVNDRYSSESYYTEMTPELCTFLYEHRTDNRPISKDKVNKIVRDIKNGNWAKTCDGFKIVFVRDSNGEVFSALGDANHRIHAFWAVMNETGKIPSNCFVRLSACQPTEISRFTDTNRPRSARDSLMIEGKNPDFAPIVHNFGYIFRENIKTDVSKSEVFHCAKVYEHSYSIIAKTFREKFSNRGFGCKSVWPLVSALLAVARVNRFDDATIEKATEFVFSNAGKAFKFFNSKGTNRDFVEALARAKSEKQNAFSGFEKIKQAGLSTVAALENKFCGANHCVFQLAQKKNGDLVCRPDDKILKAYTAETVL